MDTFRRRVVYVPTREEVVRLTLAEERRVNDEKEAKLIAALLILPEYGEEHFFGHDGAERIYITREFAEGGIGLLEGLARAHGVKSGGLYLANALARDASTVAN